MIQIALVDDHKLFRDGLCSLINSFDEYKVVIEADHGRQLVDSVTEGVHPDIVLLDISMKEMDGYETAAWLQINQPDIKVIALSMYENENAVIRMIRYGVRGYLLKDVRKQELKLALESVIAKNYYYSEIVTGRLVHFVSYPQNDDSVKGAAGVLHLSSREIDFLKNCCSEMTYKEIATKMNVSVHTVDGYRDALFEKLSIKTRVGLVLFAIKNKVFLID